MNKITLTGRIVADAEVRFTPNGDAITNFRVASDVGYGEKKSTNWFACALFGKRAEALAPHLTKGLVITVFGTLTLREWVNKEGTKQISPDVRVDEIELQGGKQSSDTQAKPQGKPQQYSTPEQFISDDVPF
ncbi:MAG TPA: single-stranded DNA-binding protein [Noviherbaspirillum sp.]|nr:single-stranded DNA-binding protein [Noviherbaspirillum sp.]